MHSAWVSRIAARFMRALAVEVALLQAERPERTGPRPRAR
jgi:hypothetical protein